MTAANLAAWGVQVAALALAGIGAARCFRWRHPHSRLRFFQALLACCVVLPLAEPWIDPPAPGPTPAEVSPAAAGAAIPVKSARPIPWEPLAGIAIAAGALLRLAQLAVGIARLDSLRRRGTRIEVEGLAGVEVREVHDLRGPAAFGWKRPVILLPATLPAGDPAIRESAFRHELQHVVRGDWVENVWERAAASLLWFHPAVWWLMERIHLAREQAVDHDVAGEGSERDRYLHSLLVSAGLSVSPAVPAATFVRRPRHLVERVAFLSQENPMSIGRTAATAAMAILVTGAAVTVSVYLFPLQAAPAPQAGESGTGPMRFTRRTAKMEGTVRVEAVVNADGEVVDARVIDGPEELRKDALQPALASRFKKDSSPRRVVTLLFDFRKEVPPPPPPPPPALEQTSFEGVDYSGLPVDVQRRVEPLLAWLQSGQRLTGAQLEQMRSQIAAVEPTLHLRPAISQEPGQAPKLRLLVTKSPAAPPDRVRVGGNAAHANLVSQVPPVYPPMAKQARVQGQVRFDVTISKAGDVANLTLVSGHPLLVGAAQEAVAQWKYRPTLLNGNPVDVQTVVDVNFTLAP